MRNMVTSILLVATVALAGCSGGGPSTGSASTEPSAAPAPQSSQILEPARQAEDAADAANQTIQRQQDALQDLESPP